MENRDINIDKVKSDFFVLLKFILSKSDSYWKNHPEDFFSVCQDIDDIHKRLCQRNLQQNS